jgi:cytoskeletal protein CcmA (bactofilin family)
MKKGRARHLIMNGSGISSGGDFDKVRIRGDGTVNGELHCLDLKVFGSADLNGKVSTSLFEIFGQGNIGEDIVSEKMKIFGETDIRGNVTVKQFKLSGSTNIHGKLVGGDIRVYGETTVAGDCEADFFRLKGVVNIGGMLNAEKVEIHLHFGDSRISEIGGERIRVTRGKALSVFNLLNLFQSHSAELLVDNIEGDDIYLEYTRAKVVRGNNITIGPGCDIELVEYKNEFRQSEKSKVGENRTFSGM